MFDMMKEAITNHAIGIGVSIVGVIVARKLQTIFKLVEDKFNIDIDDRAEKFILHMVRKAIRIVWQTYVKEKKRDGEFTGTAKKEALFKAYDLVVAEARRMGFEEFVDKKAIVHDIESELVNVKDKARSCNNFAKNWES